MRTLVWASSRRMIRRMWFGTEPFAGPSRRAITLDRRRHDCPVQDGIKVSECVDAVLGSGGLLARRPLQHRYGSGVVPGSVGPHVRACRRPELPLARALLHGRESSQQPDTLMVAARHRTLST
jgi:hypothetical protein